MADSVLSDAVRGDVIGDSGMLFSGLSSSWTGGSLRGVSRRWTVKPEMFDAPVPPELLRRVSDFPPLVDAGESVERVGIGTAPLALLVMTDGYLHIVTARAAHQWCEGVPRSSLFGRVEGEDLLFVSGMSATSAGSAACIPSVSPRGWQVSCTNPSRSTTLGVRSDRRGRSLTSPGSRGQLSMSPRAGGPFV